MMDLVIDPLFQQQLDDAFDAFSMLANGAIVSIMHVQGNTTRWSPAGVELFGLAGEYVPNGSMDWGDYIYPEDRLRYMDIMGHLLDGGCQSYDLTYRVRTKDGTYVNFRAMGAVLRDAKGKPSLIGGVLINQGLTEGVDPVTVLPNRNAFLDDLARHIASKEPAFALQVGIGGLAELNRVHGYTYGNHVLQEIAWVIQETVKERGAVYRLEGAGFAVVSAQLSREEISAVYDMIRYRLQRGIRVNGIRNILIAAGGLIAVSGTDADASTVSACLNYAFEESLRRQHGELVDFNGSINYGGSRSLTLINTIRDSILDRCRGFDLTYDPIFSAKTERFVGAEAHIYWESPEFGRVDSADFLPLLEHDFLFEELSDFVLHRALRDGIRILERFPDYLLCVNVFRIQLESDYFMDNLNQFLRETGFPAERLSLKFDNQCRYIDLSRVRALIDQLHRRGILVVIDDFGSGTDSIGFLRDAPVDAVCLDSRFVKDLETSQRDRDILEHLSKMAATCVPHINLKGVDSAALRELVREFPFTTFQGRYFSGLRSFEELCGDAERLS